MGSGMSNGKPTVKSTNVNGQALDKSIDKISRRIQELKDFDPAGIQERWDPRLEALQKSTNATLADILGARSPQYKQYAMGALDTGLETAFGDRYSSDELHE